MDTALRVLLVDPNARDRARVRRIVEGLSPAHLKECPALKDAARYASRENVDVVLVAAPKEDRRAARFVRAMRALHGLPVILYGTKVASERAARTAIEAGAIAYLARPLRPEAVRAALTQAASEVDTDGAWVDRLLKDLETHLARARYRASH